MMRSLAARVVKEGAAAADRLRPSSPGVVVLIYHRVGGGSRLEIDQPVELFAAQVESLAASGRVVDLDTALDVLAGAEAPQPDPVVVTFDDGTADFADLALPILAAHRVPATLYLATDFVDRGLPFPHEGTPLSWSAVREAHSTGLVTLGSHTHTHALLDRLAPEAIDAELDRSIELIEDNVGLTPAHFAYPKALPGSPAADAAVRQRFRSAAVGGMRPNPYTATDPYALRRSPIQVSDGMRFFERKVRGGMVLEDRIRTAANAFRYAGARS